MISSRAASRLQPRGFIGRRHLGGSGWCGHPPSGGLCGNGREMTRCGAAARRCFQGVLERSSAARCVVVTGAPLKAFCSVGRQDLAHILIAEGAARAADGRFGASQADACRMAEACGLV